MKTMTIKKNIATATKILKAMANKKRLLILCALDEGEKSVGQLEVIADLSQSALSQHLAKLRHDKIVKTRRDAQTIYYSINEKAVPAVIKTLMTYLET